VPDSALQDNFRLSSFSRVDLRVGWTPVPGWELSVVGQDLLDRSHLEFLFATSGIAEVERSIYAQVVRTF
jgi:iron complex outermembrane receptor protein